MILAEAYYDNYADSKSNYFSCETLLRILDYFCSEARNPDACRTLCNSNLFYSDACYIDFPGSALTSQVLSCTIVLHYSFWKKVES